MARPTAMATIFSHSGDPPETAPRRGIPAAATVQAAAAWVPAGEVGVEWR